MRCVGSIAVITPPAEDAAVPTLAEVKDHLGVDFSDDDDDILSKIWGAITEFEDPSLGYLARSIIPRQLELRLDAFSDLIHLPRGPILQGGDYPLAVVYDDADGEEQPLSAAVYRLLDPDGSNGRLVLQSGQSWPSTSSKEQCVRVRYWAGYDPDDVRINNFKSAVKLHVGMTYDGETEDRLKVAQTIDRLLQPYRVYT